MNAMGRVQSKYDTLRSWKCERNGSRAKLVTGPIAFIFP